MLEEANVGGGLLIFSQEDLPVCYDKQDSCAGFPLHTWKWMISILAVWHFPCFISQFGLLLISRKLKQPHACSKSNHGSRSLGWSVDLFDKILLSPFFLTLDTISTVSPDRLELLSVESREGRWSTRGILACVRLSAISQMMLVWNLQGRRTLQCNYIWLWKIAKEQLLELSS